MRCVIGGFPRCKAGVKQALSRHKAVCLGVEGVVVVVLEVGALLVQVHHAHLRRNIGVKQV